MRYLVVTLSMLIWTAAAMACETCKGAKEILPPTQQSATIADRFNGSIFVLLGTVVLAMGNRSVDDVYRALKGRVAELHLIGDAMSPRGVHHAILEGTWTGRRVQNSCSCTCMNHST